MKNPIRTSFLQAIHAQAGDSRAALWSLTPGGGFAADFQFNSP